MIVRISKWLAGIKDFIYLYHDGYFQFPYLSNSPEIMVAALKQMPFIKCNAAENVVYTNNIFTKGKVHYRELAEGFWVTATEIEFKKSICTKAVYDEGYCDYYFLTYFNYTNSFSGIPVSGWSLNEPGTIMERYFNKGDAGAFISFAFNSAWFARNVPVGDLAGEKALALQLSAKTGYITLENIVPNAGQMAAKILKVITQKNVVQFNTLTLKMHCLEAIAGFFNNLSPMLPKDVDSELHEADRKMVEKAEKILIHSLTTQFPGIGAVANLLHTSPTKLKTCFKTVNKTSLYRYYNRQQMEMALQMLKAKPIPLKDLAHTFGYDNPSKFSAAFKKQHHFLPSGVLPDPAGDVETKP